MKNIIKKILLAFMSNIMFIAIDYCTEHKHSYLIGWCGGIISLVVLQILYGDE